MAIHVLDTNDAKQLHDDIQTIWGEYIKTVTETKQGGAPSHAPNFAAVG